MNERIQELRDRAKNRSQYLLAILCNKTNRTSKEVTEQEKQELFDKTFASLIIQECIQVMGPEDSYTDEWFKAKADSVSKIKEYFGVKE